MALNLLPYILGIAVLVGAVALWRSAKSASTAHGCLRIILQVTSAAAFAALSWLILLTRTNFVNTFRLWKWHAHEVVMLRLVLLLGAVFAAEVFLLAGGLTYLKNAKWRRFIDEAKFTLKPIFWGIFFALLALAGLIAATGVGVWFVPWYWHEAGVPILGSQMALAVLMAFILPPLCAKCRATLLKIPPPFAKPAVFLIKHKDWLVSLFIFASAGIWWLVTPNLPSFFAPAPVPPTYKPYPYSDAAVLDANGWLILLGLSPLPSTDHLAVSAWLAILHSFMGLDYAAIANSQVWLYALIPVILYWLGKGSGSRIAGFVTAWFVTAQGVNSLNSDGMLEHISPKMLMSEYPTMLVLAMFTLAAVMFARAKSKKECHLWLLPLGASLAAGIMIRFNILAFSVAAVFGIVAIRGKKFWEGLKESALLILITVAVLAPWGWRSYAKIGTPVFFAAKTRKSFQAGYRIVKKPAASKPVSTQASSPVLSATPPHPTPRPKPTKKPVPTAKPTLTNTPMRKTATQTAVTTPPTSKPAYPSKQGHSTTPSTHTRAVALVQYFSHDLVTSFLSLPLTLRFAGLKETVKKFPFYRPNWFRSRSSSAFRRSWWLYVLVYLAIISLGMASAHRLASTAGLIPLGVMLIYYSATAFVNTAGGRYILPAQWVLFFYLAFGLAELGHWMRAPFTKAKSTITKAPTFTISPTVAVALVLPWAMLILWLAINDARTTSPYISPVALKQKLISGNYDIPYKIPFSHKDLRRFLARDSAVAVESFALYPRFFHAGQGIPEDHQGYHSMPFNRVAFVVDFWASKSNYLQLNRGAHEVAIFPTDDPTLTVEGDGYLILGCQTRPYYGVREGIKIKYTGYITVRAVLQKDKYYAVQNPLRPCPKR